MSDATETMVVLAAPPKRRCVLWSVSIVVTSATMLALGFVLGWFIQVLSQSPPIEAQESTPVVVDIGSGAVHEDDVVLAAAAEIAAQRLIAQAQEVPYWQRELDPARRLAIMGSIEAGAIEGKIKWLSMRTRLAGSESSHKYAEDLVQLWKSYGLSRAGVESYDVLVSYPGNTEPRKNKVQLLTLGGMVLHESPSYPSNESTPYPYTPYARPGEVEGAVVYVGAGKTSDFAVLQERGVNFTDTIALVSSTFPPLTVARIAAAYGCIGMITFPDPTQGGQNGDNSGSGSGSDSESNSDSEQDSNPEDTVPADAIRISPARPGFGDLRTPSYPSKAHTSRRSAQETRQLLSPIPIQPVSLETAAALLGSVANDSPQVEGFWSPEGWEVAPRVGGKMKHNRRVRLAVYNYLQQVPIYNAFAMVRGEIEQDRLVILGAHRDSWGHGALDDASGTAVMMEIARVFGEEIKRGWRPRRTIIFASWGAEEFGLIGSTEWVQEKLGVLQHKAVAYLNLDVAVTGTDFLFASASPLLHKLIFNISALVPHTQHSSVMAAWAEYARQRGTAPTVYPLYPVSDHTPFAFMAGVPAADVLYANQHRHYYSAYHTQYDTFNYLKTHIDPTFAHHKMVAQIVGEMLHQLADYRLLPLDVAAYADLIHRHSMAFTVTTFPWLEHGEGKELIGHLVRSIESFVETAMEFQHSLGNLDKKDPYKLRQVNDRLMLVERAFIDPTFDKDPNSIFRHVLLSPGRHECPPFQTWFPRVQDVICNPEYAPHLMDEEIPARMMEDLRDQVTLLCQAIDTATDILLI